MFAPDTYLNLLHIALWLAFGITRLQVSQQDTPQNHTPINTEKRTAPGSRLLIGLHSVAFGLMYWGMHSAILTHTVPQWFDGQRWLGGGLIITAGFIACWSLQHFHSWRLRAELDTGHQLTTDGPFSLFRHPIYLALNLLALGTAVWVPNLGCLLGLLFMVIGSDLRARAEESLLLQAFGETYAAYCRRTRRFIPGLY